jgi:mono/diheme cytochrome c family protein
MKRPVIAILAIGIAAALGLALVLRHGFSARDRPWAAEEFVARRLRYLAVPRGLGAKTNPIAATAKVVAEGRAHFADHCASCHANDGSGNTELGRNLYPKAPDMREPSTQSLSDGEIYYIIHNGIRFTGMPAWGDETGEDLDSWKLVHFIRHLPRLTPEEVENMKALNPQSRRDRESEAEIRDFLGGETDSSPPPMHH